MGMQFELTEELIDNILFFMEDQDGDFYVDTVKGMVVDLMGDFEADIDEDFDEEIDSDIEESTVNDKDRYIDLPQWESADGFGLMENFTAGLKNALIRKELRYALGQGRGVFRAFKDTLGKYPEVEKLWFSYKENEMKKEIITWYNGLREEWGLEKIGMEPEDTGDLVLEDFRFRPLAKEDFEKARELHELCLKELEEDLAGLPNVKIFDDEAPNAMCAETIGGEFAGFIAGSVEGEVLHIQCLEVAAEYRGLGIGEALLVKYLDSFNSRGKNGEISQVYFDLPSQAEGFSRVLLRESFKPHTVRYSLDMKDRQA